MKIKTICTALFTAFVLFMALNPIKTFAYSDQTEECIDRVNGHIIRDFPEHEHSDEVEKSVQKDINKFCLSTTPSLVSTVDDYSEFSDIGQIYWDYIEGFAARRILYENYLIDAVNFDEITFDMIDVGMIKELSGYLLNAKNSYIKILSEDPYYKSSPSASSGIADLIEDEYQSFVKSTSEMLTIVENDYTCDEKTEICTLTSSIVDNSPSDITDLNGILKKYNSISLNWTEATDDNGIEKYIVIYDEEPIDFSEYDSIEKLPNREYTTTNKLFIANLDDNKTYYFYVAAIDTAENMSTHWSNLYTVTFSNEEENSNEQTDNSEGKEDSNENETEGNVSNYEEPSDNTTPFADVSEAYKNNEAIIALYNQGVIGGYDDGTFKPNKTVNRAELLKILIGAKEIVIPVNEYNYCFEDVKNEWFAPYVCYAKEQGWIQGYEDNTFKPAQIVNKVESFKMLLEIYGVEVVENNTNNTSYSDIDTNAWYWKYVSKAYELGIIEDSGSLLAPSVGMRRGSFCESLYRLTK